MLQKAKDCRFLLLLLSFSFLFVLYFLLFLLLLLLLLLLFGGGVYFCFVFLISFNQPSVFTFHYSIPFLSLFANFLTADELGLRGTLKIEYSKSSFVNTFQTKGFFVDIGAGDGETNSVTLGLELQAEWEGLLVEGDPIKFKQLLSKHRRSSCLNARMSYGKLVSRSLRVDICILFMM